MFKAAKVLVVEDEEDVRNLMLLHLQRDGHQATGLEDSEKALQALQNPKNFDLVILDWMLPGLSGLELCKRLAGKLPILMVTARADTADIVLGLEMGADDYLTKPFQVSVFMARVRALLRRASAQKQNPSQSPTVFESSGLRLDTMAHKVTVHEEVVKLTPSEFKALALMMKEPGLIFSRSKLISLIQGEGITVTDRAIDTLIFGLRKNIGPCSDLIETVRGVGYRMRLE